MTPGPLAVRRSRSGDQNVDLADRRDPLLRRAEGPSNDTRTDSGSESRTATDVMQLHQRFGNRAIQRLAAAAQPKLAVGDPDDRYEREADRLADRVLQSAGPAGVRDVATGRWDKATETGDEATSAGDVGADGTVPQVQTATASSDAGATRGGGNGSPSTPPVVERVLGRSGRPLDPEVRSGMEVRFGHDFSSVRVHTDRRAVASARALGADAYTVGEHVAFDAGQYRPHSAAGQRLLAHELAHVVQQSQGQVQGPVVQRQVGKGMEGMLGGLDPSCVGLLNMPGRSTATLGRKVQKEIVRDFERKVGPTQGFAIPGATAAPLRTEGRPGDESFIKPEVFDPLSPHPLKGAGIPDLAYKNGTVMELAEIKPANWGSLWFAEEQLTRYVEHGNAEDNAPLRSRLGVTRFERMPTSRYRPPRTLKAGGRTVYVTRCGPGIILYKPKRRRRKRRRRPVEEPVLEPLLVLAGAAALAVISQLIKQLNPGRRVRAALAAIAAIVLLSTGTASAAFEPGAEGGDPIEVLFEMMAANGTPAPPELRERIENNPALRKKLEESLRSGDLTAAQQALNEDLVKMISENQAEFTDEELEMLLTASEMAGGNLPQSARTTEEIKSALQRRGIGGRGPGAEAPPPSERPASERPPPESAPGEERAEGPTPEEAGPLAAEPRPPGRTPSERWMPDAPQPVKRLFDEMVKAGTGGPRVTAEVARRFREALPDLTAAEADQLIERIRPAEGLTVDAILAQLSVALRRIREEREAEPETSDVRPEEPAGDVAGPIETRPGEASEDYVARMRRAIDDFPAWDRIPTGQPVYIVADRSVVDLPVGETFPATVFYKFEPEEGTVVRAMGVVTLRVTPDNPNPPRESVRSSSVGELVMVYDNGNVATIPLAKLPRELTIAPLTLGGK